MNSLQQTLNPYVNPLRIANKPVGRYEFTNEINHEVQ